MKAVADTHICCVLHDPAQTLWAICGQGMRDEAHQLGVHFSLRPAYTDEEHLPELIDALRYDRPDAIIFGGGDFSIPQSVLANKAAIPLVACLSAVQGAPIACNVQVDFYRAASLAATFLTDHMQGKAKIAHLQGRSHAMYTTPRTEGFVNTLAHHPGMEIVFQPHGDWSRASGTRLMEEALKKYPQVQAVYAHSDEMALGAQAALEAAVRSDVVIVSVDAIAECLLAIQKGKIAATVNIAPYEMGRVALTQAVELVQGRTVEPDVRTEPRLITAQNIQDAMLETVQVFPNVLRDVVEGYKEQRRLQEEIILAQQALIQELSTPIIPVSDSILVVPLIGSIDRARASQMTSSILEAVGKQSAKVLIIDITGVAVVDTNVVNHLLQTARAAQMIGTTVLLVGISPDIAQTIVHLGVDLSKLITRSTLQAGLEYATKYLRV